MSAQIVRIATAVPEHDRSQESLLARACELVGGYGEDQGRVERIYRNAGVDRRASVLFGEDDIYERGSPPSTARRMAVFEREAPELARRACERAMDGLDGRVITHIVTACCTGLCAPGIDQALIASLGLRADVERTHIGFMGCHAQINALRVARAICEARADSVVLVCCAELCSLHFSYEKRMDAVVANALFSDGAAACVVAGRDGPSGLFAIESCASVLLPESSDLMGWRIGDQGFRMVLGPQVGGELRRGVGEWVRGWLDRQHGIGVHEVRALSIHPGGRRVLDAVRDSLGVGEERMLASRRVLARHGNMSSATVAFILKDQIGSLRPGDRVLMLAFGPGLAGEGVLLRRLG